MMKSFIQNRLRRLAEKIIRTQRPKIVAVTGSVGKTSAKEAIAAVLGQEFRVRGAKKNYNNELGVPLTIIGADSPARSLLGWLAVWMRARKLAWSKAKDYPEWLVLELGADRKGDIQYLCDIAPPDVAVVTAVSAAHTEFFGSVEEVAEEKGALVRALKSGGIAVLNGDDPHVRDMEHDVKGTALLYGFGDEAVRADGVEMEFPDRGAWPRGMAAILRYHERAIPFMIEGAVGRHALYPALAGAAVGLAVGLSMEDVEEGLRHYLPPSGRMRLIPGIKNTLIIDDTYNSSPLAAIAAVETLAEIEPAGSGQGERYAVLGDMVELGNLALESHVAVGRRVAELGVDVLMTVGELGKEIGKSARAAGMAERRVEAYNNSEEAGLALQEKLEPGDVALVKGSQVVRMEKIVKEVMAEPLRAEELLVRMDESWAEK
ncbi:MAG: UDP-N-acetylmuramoyl-tripeptide--D-alanyl-D-alanine ligase [Patescibacteria group bacterium]